MMKKAQRNCLTEDVITMTVDDFIAAIGAGRSTAIKIAEQAEAKIYIGRRLLINVGKVRKYLDSISE